LCPSGAPSWRLDQAAIRLATGECPNVDPGSGRRGGAGMPKVVVIDMLQVGPLAVDPECAVDTVRFPRGFRISQLRADAGLGRTFGAEGPGPLFDSLMVGRQDGDRRSIERDSPCTVGQWFLDLNTTPCVGNRSPDRDGRLVDLAVRPSQTAELASAASGGRSSGGIAPGEWGAMPREPNPYRLRSVPAGSLLRDS
jgi:hypothetical protein